jgi:isoleucyl-tRNA synthetase
LPSNVVLAKNLVETVLKGFFATEDMLILKILKKEIKDSVSGMLKQRTDLVGIKYEQLMPLVLPYQNPENAFRVISGDFVTTEDGTGIVHTSPTLVLMMLK